MSGIAVTQNVKEASIEAVVIRADGRVERLGKISYYHRNPLRRLAWRITELVRRLLK